MSDNTTSQRDCYGRPSVYGPENMRLLSGCQRPHEFVERNTLEDHPYNCMQCKRCGGRVSIDWAIGYKFGLADSRRGEYATDLQR